MDAGQGLVRTSAKVSLVIAITRALGFVRWIVLAVAVGATSLGDVYQTANWVPNILFELIAGGVLSWVFVPVFLAEMRKGPERSELVISTIANLLLLVSIPLTIAGFVFAEPIIRGFTVGAPDPAVRARQVEIGVFMLRLFLPQVPLYMAGMVMRGVLHARSKLLVPAAAPAFTSVFQIASFVAFAVMGLRSDVFEVTKTQQLVLGLGATLGVAAWCGAQFVPLVRMGVRWRPVLALRDEVVRSAIRACGHGVSFYAITQVGYVTTLVLANRVPGGVVAFQMAQAFFEIPNAVIGYPVSMTVLPQLSKHAIDGDPQFAPLLSKSLRTTAALLLPAAAGLAVAASPLTDLIFAGRDASPALVRACLIPLAIGLPGYALTQALSRACYALQQASKPVWFNAVNVAVYVALVIPATLWLSPRGTLALAVMASAYAVGLWAGAIPAVVSVRNMVPAWPAGRDLASFGGFLVRSAIMGGVALVVMRAARPLGAVVALVACVASGVVVYALLTMRSPDVRAGLRAFRRREAV